MIFKLVSLRPASIDGTSSQRYISADRASANAIEVMQTIQLPLAPCGVTSIETAVIAVANLFADERADRVPARGLQHGY